MRSITVSSPAKVNLFLKVLGRRTDGYHELITVFHRISLKDKITIKKIKKPEFLLKTNLPELRSQNNLIYKAYLALKKVRKWEGGIQVKLSKEIPIGAGLGGGSSNAAHFLLAMNRLFNLELSIKQLAKLALKLGADVPFFIYNTNQAIGTGVGEHLKMANSSSKRWFCLVVPPYKLSTALVFKRLKAPSLTRISRDATMTSVFSQVKSCDWKNLLRNDLFKASCLIRPELKKLDMLFDQAHAFDHLMSGSGSSMFSIHNSKAEATRVARFLKRGSPRAKIFICHSY